MNTKIQIFNYKKNQVRTAGTPERPLFCASDVFKLLGHTNGFVALKRLFNEHLDKLPVYTPKGYRDLVFLTEAQLYKIIMRSEAKNAKTFQDWVCNEVLPSIRKNGGYINNQENLSADQVINNALEMAKNIINNKQITNMNKGYVCLGY